MPVYPTLVLRNIVTKQVGFWRTLNLFFQFSVINLVWSEWMQKWNDKQTGFLKGKQTHMETYKKLPSIYTFTEDGFFANFSAVHFNIYYWLYSERTWLWTGKSYKIFCQVFFILIHGILVLIHEVVCSSGNRK